MAKRYRLDDQVGFILRRVTQRHLTIFAQAIPDLTPQQFAALAKLRETGPISQNLLGRRTAMDAATIKGVVDRLRNRGLVATSPDPKDNRRLVVSISGEGDQVLDEYLPAAHAITEQTLAPLGDQDRKTFLALLGKLT